MNVSREGLGAMASRWNRFSRVSPPFVFFYRSRFLLRDNRVLNGLLGTFYPNLSPLRNVSLIYDGGLSSLIHQPFTDMVNPVRLGFTAMGSTLFVLVWETQRKPTSLTIRTFLTSFTPPWCITSLLMDQ